jgi:sugar phosphate isomerase/epimerase
MSKIPVALQLYTVRDECEKDFEGTLKRVAQIGYRAVQVGDMYGMTATELKATIDRIGLKVCAIHVDIDPLLDNLDKALDDAKRLDCSYITCPYLPDERHVDADAWHHIASLFAKIGERCAQAGIRFSYHNHDFDFHPVGDSSGYEILMANTDPKWLAGEVDVYWAQYAGRNPVDTVSQLAGRCPLIHLKDMANDEERSFTELGNGILDFDAIIPACEKAGSRWLIVEQDTCEGSALESARISLEYLKSKGWA